MKKRFLFICLILLSVQTSFSQNEIFVGINVSPKISIPTTNPQLDFLDNQFNSSFGIKVLYGINRKFSLETGLNFNQNSFSIKDMISTTRFNYIDMNGNGVFDTGDIISDELLTYDYVENYQSINIPIELNYTLTDNETTNFLISGGIEVGYLFNINYKIDYSNNDMETIDRKHQDFIGGLNLGIGVSHNISNNFLLKITPTYSYLFYPDWGKNSLGFQEISLSIDLYYGIN